MNTGTTILVLGVGVAAFLYWKSQRDQAAALQAAAGAPGPGLLQKTENTLKTVFSAKTARAVAGAPTHVLASGAATVSQNIAGRFSSSAGSVLSSITHIF